MFLGSTPPRARRAATSGQAVRRTGTGGLAALVALGTLPAVVGLGTGANAAVVIGENISAFPDRDMVVAVGYQVGEQLLVEVLRDDVVIGTAQGPAVSTPEGVGLEVNHGAEGTPAPGDCWINYTPDIIGGDVIRVTPLGRQGAAPDTMTVKNLAFSGAPFLEPNGDVSVTGTADPTLSFGVEFRRDKPDPRFRRGPFQPVFEAGTNNWKATYRVESPTSGEGLTVAEQQDIALNTASWAAVADQISETTLAELGEPAGVAAGCTGSADPNTLVGGLEPINITSGDVTFSGTARAGVQAVTVTVGGLGALPATFTPDPTATSPWTLTVPKTELAKLPDGTVAVTPHFDTLNGTTRNVVKDTVAPAAPTATPTPGNYTTTQNVALNKPAGETSSKVYWEIGGATVPDPDQFSTPYTSQISVSSSQTIKGRVIDAAGNLGAVGTFAYTIGPADTTPPPAPGVTPASGTYRTAQSVAMTTTENGAVIRYTVGTSAAPPADPTAASTLYTAALTVGESQVIKAAAFDAAGNRSTVVTRTYTIDTVAPPAPGVTPASGTYTTAQSVTMTAEAGAVIRYTVGTGTTVPADPTATSTQYTGAVAVGSSQVIKAAAFDAAGNRSTIETRTYTITLADTTPPPAPGVTPASGTYTTAQSVAMTTTEAGAVIRYTVGTGTTVPADPTVTSTQYTAAVPVSSSQVIKAAAFDAAGNRSTIVTRTYTISTPSTGDTVAPTVTPSAPLAGATGVSQTNNITMRFSESVQGVTSSTVVLTNTATDDTIPATVTYKPDTLGTILDPGSSLAAGTSYTVTVTGGATAIRDVAGNPLVTRSWSFTTAGTSTSNTAPTVTNRSPGSGATGVALGSDITATFSEAVQGVSGTTFTLRTSAGVAVSGLVTYNSTTRVATLNPGSNLTANTSYTATLTGGTSAIRDSQNLALATTSWTFTTASSSTGNTAPTLVKRSPGVNATGFSRGFNITMNFSEAVQGVSTSTVTLRNSATGATVTSTVTYKSDTFGVILDPGVTLAANTRYTVTVTNGIRDLGGLAFAGTSWSFTTGA